MEQPAADNGSSPLAIVLHVAVLLIVAAGVVALWNDLATRWRIVMLVVVVVVAGVRLLPLTALLGTPGTVVEYAGAAIGLIVIPIFALLGIDAALAKLDVDPVAPLARLLIAVAIVLVVARVSLEPFWTGHELPHPWGLAAGATFALTVLPAVGIAVLGQINGDGRTLDQRPAVTRLDVVVLRSGAASSAPATTVLGSWRINTWTGQVRGRRISWAGGRRPQLSGEADTDRVLILLPPASDNAAAARWMSLADRVEPRATPTYAVLDRASDAQLAAWNAPLSGPTGRAGTALALSSLSAGARASEAKLAVLAATEAPTAASDLALAIAHRPILRFDKHEPVPRPLDVDELFQTGAISMCEAGQKFRARCVKLHGGDELKTGFNHMAFDSHTLATARVASRIYVNATHIPATATSSGRIYLDYWWYLPDNPAHSGSGAFCGPGFSLPGYTCFDHQSDWEGVTVVLDERNPAGQPLAVNYAQHDGSARYSWTALQRLWALTRARGFAPAGALDARPLVFSARGTHASYPIACGDVSCPRNVVPNLRNTAALQDNPHDGNKAWENVTDMACAATCVAELPTRRGGAEAEGWNAWAGEWGTANCVMGLFCSSADPPHSPGRQDRYKHPWCTKAAFDLRAGQIRAVGTGGCVTQPRPSGDLTRGSRLLALGDSYSSGEGAGDYEPGTDSSTNTCHRSRSAWPTLLAERRGLTALPSIACSGATLTDLLAGRRGSPQPERRRDQLGRVDRNANVVTVTIGGNDLGFRKILETCIVIDCVAHFHRPSGDALDARIDALARRLPAAYRAIQAAAPNARIVVVDYPRLFRDGTPNCAALHRITVAESDYLNRKVERADVAILDAAAKANVTGIDVAGALQDGELTCSGTQYLNRTNLRLKLVSGSFHPNAKGQERLAQAVAAALANLGR